MTYGQRFTRRTLAAALFVVFLSIIAHGVTYSEFDVIFVVTGMAGCFVSIRLGLAAPFIIVHGLAGRLFREYWKRRYIRISFDIALMGLITLFILTFSSYHGVRGHLSDLMQKEIEAYDRLVYWQGFSCPRALTEAEANLKSLTRVSWFLEHFPVYVILPGGLFFLAGYSSERATKVKKPSIS